MIFNREKLKETDFDKNEFMSDEHKKYFLILIAIVVFYVLIFLLYATGVISLLVADIFAVPVTLVIVLMWLRSKTKY